MSLYNIYSFVISVEGPADTFFLKEYGWAKIEHSDIVNIYIKPGQKRDNPTKPAGLSIGMYLPFEEDEQTLYYDEGVPSHAILLYCEALLYWSEKTFLHAGGVVKGGKALIFTGTGNVGKTSIVLNLLNEGFEYLSDDWVVIGEGMAFPFPKPIHVFDYNLKNPKMARAVLGRKHGLYKPYFKFLDFARKHSPHRFLRYAFENVKPMYSVNLNIINPNAKVGQPSPISKVFYLERTDIDKVTVTNAVDPESLARRMANVSMYERNYLYKEYCRYVTLYGVRSQKIENQLLHNASVMTDAFKGAQMYRVQIPHGYDLTKVKLSSILDLS